MRFQTCCNFLYLSREPSSNLPDINVRQTPSYKNSHPHSAYGHSTPRSTANTHPFIDISSTGSVMHA